MVNVTESRVPGGKDGNLVEIDEKELSGLKESVRQTTEKVEGLETKLSEATDRADRAEDALLTERATRIVSETLADEGDPENEDALPKLPERATERVKEAALKSGVPTNEDGSIDKDKLIERVRKAAKEEDEYLHGKDGERAGSGVTGMGESRPGGGGGGEESSSDEQKKLEEAFVSQGMSEEAAKVAAKGR
jgi:phage shock protein A